MEIELFFEDHKFDKKEFDAIQSDFIKNFPILYILYNSQRKDAYIGQTVNVKRRMNDHLKNSDRKHLTDTLLIGHDRFNQSATYNIETKLINYFLADGMFKLQNKSQTTSNQVVHNYYQKKYYNDDVFQEIWKKLIEKKLAQNSSDVIQNKDVYKLSPFHQLSDNQLEVKETILNFCKEHIGRISENEHKVFFVEGEAGTGKSVVLSSLYNEICNLSKENSSPLYDTENYLLVNHTEVLKTYQTMSKSLPNMKKKNILKPTPFVNAIDKDKISKSDITLIDEAHLLLTSKDSYNNFNFDNQLKTIIERSKVTIIIYDPKQVLKLKSYWNNTRMESIVKDYDYETLKLKDQFRMQASDEVINWIDQFVNEKKVLPAPQSTDDYQFEIVNSPDELKSKIKTLNSSEKLSRIVSTFDYLHKKDGKKYFVDKEGVNLPWNIVSDEVWAEDEVTIDQVGSIYTVQGFDLNYVGVILGPSVSYDIEKDCVVINHFKYQDKGAFTVPSDFDISLVDIDKAKEEIILNSINVLMKRGVKGLFIYATDKKLKHKLQQMRVEGKKSP